MLSINDKATAVSDTAFHSELIREAFPRNRLSADAGMFAEVA